MKISFTPEKLRKYIFIELIVLFSLIFLGSSGFLIEYLLESAKQRSQYDQLASLVEQVQQSQQNNTNSGTSDSIDGNGQAQPSKYTTVVNPANGKEMEVLSEYAPIYNLNPHVIGWIEIEGTKINYPVMQTPEWVNYYLTRDFNGETSKHGAIYMNEAADILTPSDNITIYGHKMKDGSMFAALHDYKKESFYKDHSYITFDSLFEHHQYQIFAVFVTTANTADSFNYHEFVNGDFEEFEEFVANCKALSLYDTGVDAVYGDKLITLSTCEHSISDGRLVVVAKRIT